MDPASSQFYYTAAPTSSSTVSASASSTTSLSGGPQQQQYLAGSGDHVILQTQPAPGQQLVYAYQASTGAYYPMYYPPQQGHQIIMTQPQPQQQQVYYQGQMVQYQMPSYPEQTSASGTTNGGGGGGSRTAPLRTSTPLAEGSQSSCPPDSPTPPHLSHPDREMQPPPQQPQHYNNGIYQPQQQQAFHSMPTQMLTTVPYLQYAADPKVLACYGGGGDSATMAACPGVVAASVPAPIPAAAFNHHSFYYDPTAGVPAAMMMHPPGEGGVYGMPHQQTMAPPLSQHQQQGVMLQPIQMQLPVPTSQPQSQQQQQHSAYQGYCSGAPERDLQQRQRKASSTTVAELQDISRISERSPEDSPPRSHSQGKDPSLPYTPAFGEASRGSWNGGHQQQHHSDTPISSLRRRSSLPPGQPAPMMMKNRMNGPQPLGGGFGGGGGSPVVGYKTRMCLAWGDRGECRMGENCRFAHGNEELRLPEKSQRLLTNPKYKTRLCRNFGPGGPSNCSYGERCEFIHPEDPEFATYRHYRYAYPQHPWSPENSGSDYSRNGSWHERADRNAQPRRFGQRDGRQDMQYTSPRAPLAAPTHGFHMELKSKLPGCAAAAAVPPPVLRKTLLPPSKSVAQLDVAAREDNNDSDKENKDRDFVVPKVPPVKSAKDKSEWFGGSLQCLHSASRREEEGHLRRLGLMAGSLRIGSSISTTRLNATDNETTVALSSSSSNNGGPIVPKKFARRASLLALHTTDAEKKHSKSAEGVTEAE